MITNLRSYVGVIITIIMMMIIKHTTEQRVRERERERERETWKAWRVVARRSFCPYFSDRSSMHL